MHMLSKVFREEEVYADSDKSFGKLEIPIDAFAEVKKNNGQDYEYANAFLCIDFVNNRFAFAILGLEDESKGRGKHTEDFTNKIKCIYDGEPIQNINLEYGILGKRNHRLVDTISFKSKHVNTLLRIQNEETLIGWLKQL